MSAGAVWTDENWRRRWQKLERQCERKTKEAENRRDQTGLWAPWMWNLAATKILADVNTLGLLRMQAQSQIEKWHLHVVSRFGMTFFLVRCCEMPRWIINSELSYVVCCPSSVISLLSTNDKEILWHHNTESELIFQHMNWTLVQNNAHSWFMQRSGNTSKSLFYKYRACSWLHTVQSLRLEATYQPMIATYDN